MHVQTIIDESIASFFEEWVEKMKRTDPSPEESLDHILKGECIISIKKKRQLFVFSMHTYSHFMFLESLRIIIIDLSLSSFPCL